MKLKFRILVVGVVVGLLLSRNPSLKKLANELASAFLGRPLAHGVDAYSRATDRS